MKKIIYILIFVLTTTKIFGQDKTEETFKKVVDEGMSTAPDYLVIIIKNLNNNKSKEIFIEATSLRLAIKKELNLNNDDNINSILLENSKNRTFEFKSNEALQTIHFDKYELKSGERIEKIVKKNNLIDSLSRINEQRRIISEKFYEYSEKRDEILMEIKLKILQERQLTSEENKILADLSDQYYDYYYNKLAKISKQGKKLINYWNKKIKLEKLKYKKYTEELERLEKKFFRDYFAEFGLSYCHILFKYGAIFNRNCENGLLEFNQIIDL